MKEAQGSTSHLSDIMQRKATRRGFLGTAAYGAGWAFFQDHEINLFPPVPSVNSYELYNKGYEFVSQNRQAEILGEPWKEYLSEYTRSNSKHENGLFELNFHIEEPSFVSFEVLVPTDPDVSLSFFEIQKEGDRDVLLTSVLRDTYTAQRVVPFGMLPAGEHTFSVNRSVAERSLSGADLLVRPFIPRSSNVFYERLMQSLPKFAMRHDRFVTYMDNAAPMEAREKAANHGMLFFLTGRLRENEEGLIRVELGNGNTDEEGGLGRSPELLEDATSYHHDGKHVPGRVYDYDVSVILTMTPEGRILEVTNQRDSDTTQHDFFPPLADFTPPVLPTDTLFTPFREYQIVPRHGMTHVGFGYDANGNPSHHATTRITRQVSIEPDFAADDHDSVVWKEMDRARRLIGVRVNLERIEELLSLGTPDTGTMYQLQGNLNYLKNMVNSKTILEKEQRRLEKMGI